MNEKVIVDVRLQSIVPKFLDNQREDFARVLSAFKEHKYEELERLGHKFRGTCGGYGFKRLGDLGADLEKAAKSGNGSVLADVIAQMDQHFSSMQIEYRKV